MDLSIIVVNWNTRELLRRCLKSIYRTVQGITFEVIVVDNGSTDGSLELVTSVFPDVVLISNKTNRGFAGANNQGMHQSHGRHILLLNSDAELLDRTTAHMVEFLDSHPHVGAVGGKLLNADGTFQNSFADFPNLVTELFLVTGLSRWLCPPGYPSYPEAQSQHQRAVDWVSGALLMVRREATARVGLLDEDYFMYVEEVDWCYRIKQAGWDICYLPEARAIHSSGASYARVPERKRAHLYRSKCQFLRKHRGRLQATIYHGLLRAFSVIKLAVWLALGLGGEPTRREHARQNVVSYRALLARL